MDVQLRQLLLDRRNGGNEEKWGMVGVFRDHSWLLRF